ncbi:unnamed protein product [Urochloa decumbens]|uniref:Uncharacterized protein n=1 Tax=Urochloa decumbens TaxID=240449 RepID=A0ABC9BZB2_9POAL
MATTPASGGDAVVTVEPTAQANVAGGELTQSESSANMVRTKLKRLNMIAFFLAFLEWVGNAVGTLAFLWGTVVLLGGFCSLLSRMDFWFVTVMIFMEGSSQELLEESGSCGLLLQILETILPILFFWSIMFPLPGISLKISFYMLFSVVAAVLIGNLQIPLAFLQVLLSILRLRSLLGHHHHHDYHPLPPDASPNLVPSIVVFFMLELCQGSSYILAVILGFISILRHRSLVRDLKFEEEWGSNAVNLYYRRAYQARTEKGLLPLEKSTPSLDSLSIESLCSTSSETQILGLRVLDNFLQRWDSKSKKKLIAEITFTSKKAVPALVDMLGSTIAGDSDIRLFAASVITELTGSIKISEFPGMVRLISLLLDYKNQQDSLLTTGKIFEFPGVVKLIYSLHVLDAKNRQDSQPNCISERNEGNVDRRHHSIRTVFGSTLSQQILFPLLGMSILQRLSCDPDNCKEIIEGATYITTKTIGLIRYVTNQENNGGQQKKTVIRSSLNFVRWHASNTGKIGARFRRELSENPFLLNSLGHILDGDCQPELWEPVMDIIAALALDHEAASQEIGSTQFLIPKLICAFLRHDDVNTRENNDHSLQMAAGEALANLTIKSTDNCWAILFAEQGHNLINKLVEMLDDEVYVCVAANLLHNLCANSRDKLVDIKLGASMQLESALPKVMQIIMTSKEGKKLEAALCITSRIGYVIPKCFRKVLISEIDAAALVEKLVDTLNSNREPCPEYPRIRRVLVEAVISIARLCPVPYRTIFREKKARDALEMVKGTPSGLEKYRVFINGKGVLPESLPMRILVDKAKKLILRPTPTPTMSAEQGDHA